MAFSNWKDKTKEIINYDCIRLEKNFDRKSLYVSKRFAQSGANKKNWQRERDKIRFKLTNAIELKLTEDCDHLGGFFRENPLNADRKNQPKPKKAIKDPILEKLKIWAELLGVKEHQVN